MSGELSSDQLQQLYLCSLLGRKREQPIFTCKAHVFHIDPMTKRSWVPASSAAVPVSYFYDSSRALYRIISVEGTKAVINSTVSPGMNFTKTSQKFGQWSDVRANTVYGLGFPSEAELNKFSEQFSEVREATRASGKHSQSSHHVPMSNNLTGLNNAATIPPPSMMSSPLLQRSQINQQQQHQNNLLTQNHSQQNGQNHEDSDVMMNDANANSLMKGSCSTLTKGLGVPPVPNSLANNIVTNIATIDSPKHTGTLGRQDKSPEAQLKYENERLRMALAQSSVNAKKWEVELSTLKTNNARLTAALTESTANVEEWKRQLHAYKEENQRLKQRTLEAEAAKGNSDAALELRNEIGLMREKVDYQSQQLESKDEELRMLNEIVNGGNSDAVKENELLRATLNEVQAQLETALATQDSQRKVLEALNSQLADKVKDLGSIHRELYRCTTELNTVLQT